MKYALLSVYDKTGIVELAKELEKLGYSIISTGGTAKALQESNVTVIPIQEITGNPESFDGRMKTMSFQIESGILFDRHNPKHVKEAEALHIKPIDIVVCNLYPFEQTISKENVTQKDAIEQIDVGGPTMVRSAAKNFNSVVVITNPSDYQPITELLKKGEIPLEERKKLAAKAFAHLSFYDSIIADYLSDDIFPHKRTLPLRKLMQLRYGENPHQQAAVYMFPMINSPFNHLEKKAGRELSHVNITDINAGLESVGMFKEPAAVIIKHNCPCGVALGETADEALKRAIAADPESAFGGIIVMNKPMTLTAAKEIGQFKDERKANIDIVAVPSIEDEALEYLKTVRKTMGIYTFGEIPQKTGPDEHIKQIDGGLVIQTEDFISDDMFKDWKVVTKKQPSQQQMEQIKIAWKFITRIKSNAIIIVDKEIPMTRGIGTGQTSRIRSTKIAIDQAGKHAKGGILASDSFFPFDDSVQLATKAGIGAIVQQGGSINDQASIDAADKAGIPMVFTGRRAFWH